MDFALPLKGSLQNKDVQTRLWALRDLGVQHVIFAREPMSVSEAEDELNFSAGIDDLNTIAGLVVEVVPAYWLDEEFEMFVRRHPLTAYGGKYVLLALRDFNSVHKLKGTVFEIRVRGYEPVILHHDPNQIKSPALAYLSDLGCRFQLNLLALSGAYGLRAKSKAEILVCKGWANTLTTGIRTANDIALLHGLTLPIAAVSALEQVIGQHKQFPLSRNE